MNRKLVVPAIYKHFKHMEDGPLNNHMYVTIGVSKPATPEEIDRSEMNVMVLHTENNKIVFVAKLDDGTYIHKPEIPEELVLYKSLYDDTGVYARPSKIFKSEVDHNKYPNVKQKYRFEEYTAGQTY